MEIIFKLSSKAFEQYRQTKGNESTHYRMASLKMYRNMKLSKLLYTNGNKKVYQYGSMKFKVVNDNLVVWMHNYQKVPRDWQLDKKEYVRLSRELGIDQDVTVADLYIKDLKRKLKYWKNKLKWKLKGLVINNG